MQTIPSVGNRREFLKLSGTIAFGVVLPSAFPWISQTAAGLPEPGDQLPGFDPAKADSGKLKEWTQSAVRAVNAIQAGTARFSDFDSLANTYLNCLLYLHSLNFDEAGEKYIAGRVYLPGPSVKDVSNWYARVVETGLKTNRQDWNAMIAKSRNPKYLDEVAAYLSKDHGVQFHRKVADAIRSSGKESPLAAGNGNLVLSSYPVQLQQAKFSDQTCMFLDWGGVYLGVVALPIGVTPVGMVLGVFALGLWVIAKLGC